MGVEEADRPDPQEVGAEERRSGFVALVGAPNAGKSTLLNRLVGSKVSIVTHKIQTTRTRILGIALEGPAQIVFVDTPGIFDPQRRLERAMVRAAWSGAADADLVVLLVDAAREGALAEGENIAKRLGETGRRLVLALNKIDHIRRDKLLPWADRLSRAAAFERVFMISALEGHGVDDLRHWLAAQLPPGPWLYPEDQIATMPERFLAAELVREKLFLRLHQELPYNLTVETERWEDFKDGSIRIDQVIYVQRDAQKAILLGKKGERIKIIRAAAQEELAEILEAKIHLFLYVKVKERWAEDPERYREMGLEFDR